MELERIKGADHEMYGKAMELYGLSFPPHEQRKAASQVRILDDEDYHFDLIYDGAVFVGLILCWNTKDFIYIEHFCILPEMRNKKYGQRALELLGRQGKTVILEIDPPADAISARRKVFYERCGFSENPYLHIHPPYHEGSAGHKLVVMSFPHRLTQAEYDGFAHYLERHVMADVYA